MKLKSMIWCLLVCAAALVPGFGATTSPNGAILSRSVVAPAEWNEKTIGKRLSRDEYREAAEDTRFVLERISYASDGLEVVAFLYRPQRQSGSYPAVIFNKGGYLSEGFDETQRPFVRRLALEGFVVIAPSYRQSDGAGGTDEVGGSDVDDVVNTVPLLKALGFVDMDRLFMFGESRGGMMTYQAIRDRVPLRAAATVGAFTDFDALIRSDAATYGPLVQKIWPDYEKRKAEIEMRRSAILWPEALTVPLLILHGGSDGSVNPSQSLALATSLQTLGRSYEVHVIAGGNHTLSNRRRQRDDEVVSWFRQFLP